MEYKYIRVREDTVKCWLFSQCVEAYDGIQTLLWPQRAHPGNRDAKTLDGFRP